MGTAVEASALLDMSKPINVPLLDNLVHAFYQADSPEQVCTAPTFTSNMSGAMCHLATSSRTYLDASICAVSATSLTLQTAGPLADPGGYQ